MRTLVLAMTVMLGLAGAARADEAAMRSVISDQIAAFLADDFATAFSYASPTIQRLFGTPDRFGVMVREGYPMVWRPAEVEFLGVEVIDGVPWQSVLVTDAQGRAHILDYQMVRGEDGWKINAVRLRQAPAGTVRAPHGGLSFG